MSEQQQTYDYSRYRTRSKALTSDTPKREHYEKMFRDMEKNIKDLKGRLTALESLLKEMTDDSNKGVFDPEDINEVNLQYDKKMAELEALEGDYRRKRDYYDTALLAMEQKVETRRQILEKVDTAHRVFDNNPELKDFFINKQALLTKYYRDTCTLLSH
jgi:chromosome segregation ATPase